MKLKRAIQIVGLLALPATASANVGAPIAPGVGLELGLYLPGLILIEFLVLRLTLPLTWKQALACSTEWNIITTLVGFPVVLFLIYVLLLLSAFAGLNIDQTFGAAAHLYATIPPARYPEKQPESWYTFVTYAMLLWTVVAFAISVEIEERLARYSPLLARVDRNRIHWTVLAANLISYIPLWTFTSLQHQFWR